MSRTTLTSLALLATVLNGLSHDAAAGLARRPLRKSQPTSPTHTAPDTTSTIPQGSQVIPGDEALPTPFEFPAVPRARMRLCGEKWQAIKMSGKAEDQTWRDFATKCLVEAEEAKKALP